MLLNGLKRVSVYIIYIFFFLQIFNILFGIFSHACTSIWQNFVSSRNIFPCLLFISCLNAFYTSMRKIKWRPFIRFKSFVKHKTSFNSKKKLIISYSYRKVWLLLWVHVNVSDPDIISYLDYVIHLEITSKPKLLHLLRAVRVLFSTQIAISNFRKLNWTKHQQPALHSARTL